MKLFYEPSQHTLEVLNNRPWVASYSGGKDSTTVVTYIEWLRRIGLVTANPKLVMSDTGVEYPFLRHIADKLMDRLTDCGWKCEVVKPLISEKLYNRIFGRGNVPVHPSNRKMRWCTNATKIQPMGRYSKEAVGAEAVMLTGVRWGESDTRDGKLKLTGCAAGGECGLPLPGKGTYGPIITWKTCQVLDWLLGGVDSKITNVITDLVEIARELVAIYKVKKGEEGFGFLPLEASSLRFGCIGCPAVSSDKVMIEAVRRGDTKYRPLQQLYGIWDEMYKKYNRVWKQKNGKWVCGPVKMEVRQRFFAILLKIQQESGVILVDKDDQEYIRNCWRDKMYPRGWSAEDEGVLPPLQFFTDTTH